MTFFKKKEQCVFQFLFHLSYYLCQQHVRSDSPKWYSIVLDDYRLTVLVFSGPHIKTYCIREQRLISMKLQTSKRNGTVYRCILMINIKLIIKSWLFGILPKFGLVLRQSIQVHFVSPPGPYIPRENRLPGPHACCRG